MNDPRFIFIIPYRDREQHKHFFERQMEYLLEDYNSNSYKTFFVHQKDNRTFNRGAMKNIGFLAIKKKYPESYKNMTFIFHDVDTLPYKKNLIDYETDYGVVKHFYGYKFALGGIFSIKGEDFEKTSGFPNFWGWGGEDNIIQKRVLNVGLSIDRSCFFPIGNNNILQFADGFIKSINRNELSCIENDDSGENIYTLKKINYDFENEYINVYSFNTKKIYDRKKFESHDIRKGNNKIKIKKKTSKNLQKLIIF
jgi:hypothetical protein